MITAPFSDNSIDYVQYVVWIITIIVVALGIRYSKDIIAFVLDKFYAFFIENNLLRQ